MRKRLLGYYSSRCDHKNRNEESKAQYMKNQRCMGRLFMISIFFLNPVFVLSSDSELQITQVQYGKKDICYFNPRS